MIIRTVVSIVLCLVFNLGYGNASRAPDFINVCNSLAPECLIKATQDAIPHFVKGIPELGLEPLDPFTIELLEIPLQGLVVSFHKGKVSGFRNTIVDNVISNLDKRLFILEFHTNITIEGLYKAKGQLLLFPINGGGKAKLDIVNLRMKLNINTKYIKDDNGDVYFGIRNYDYTFDYGDKMTFDLENLFKESKQLSETVLMFLNENWRTVAEEFGKPIVDYSTELACNTVLKFFKKVPIKDLLDLKLPSPLPGVD